jgi:molecular chaperone DnaJ
LIDEDKRKEWDNEHYSANRSHGYDHNPFDEFNDDIFKDKSRTYHDTFTSGASRKRRGDNIVREISLDFMDAIKGVAIGTVQSNPDIVMERKSTCPACGGNKCKPGTAPTRCLSCGGSGSTIYRRGGIVMHLEC